MNKLLGVIFILFLLFFFSCEKDSGPLIVEPIVPNPPSPVFVSYANEIQPIFNANCVHCHNETHPFLNLLTCCSWDELLISGASAPYVDTLYPSESYLYIRIAGAGQNPPEMPPGGPFLLQAETDKILKWIQEGAKNN